MTWHTIKIGRLGGESGVGDRTRETDVEHQVHVSVVVCGTPLTTSLNPYENGRRDGCIVHFESFLEPSLELT